MSGSIIDRINDSLLALFDIVNDAIYKSVICDKTGTIPGTITRPDDITIGATTSEIEYLRLLSISLQKQLFIDQSSKEFLTYYLEQFFRTVRLDGEADVDWIARTQKNVFSPRVSLAALQVGLSQYATSVSIVQSPSINFEIDIRLDGTIGNYQTIVNFLNQSVSAGITYHLIFNGSSPSNSPSHSPSNSPSNSPSHSPSNSPSSSPSHSPSSSPSSSPSASPSNFSIWYLPSKDELAAMRSVLASTSDDKTAHGFVGDFYLSSSELSSGTAWGQRFSTGIQYSLYKSDEYYVRAVRSFNSSIPYNVGDVGPEGGWVIAKTNAPGTLYMECAPVDQDSYIPWITGGDLQTTICGASQTAQWKGLSNTTVMYLATGFTGGAAKVCLDYSV